MARQGRSGDDAIEGLTKGDQAAWKASYDRYADRLFRRIQRQRHACLCDDDIDDVVAESFKALWHKLQNGVADDFEPWAFLIWIARKRVATRIRFEDTGKAELTRTAHNDLPDPKDHREEMPFIAIEARECTAVLDAVVAELPLGQRRALDWSRRHRNWEGFKEVYGIPAEQGRSMATKARAKLDQAWKQYQHGKQEGGRADEQPKKDTA